MDDAIELCMFTSGQGCEALPVVGVLVPKFQIAVARFLIHMPSTFNLVYSYVRKRIGVRGDRSAGFLKGQT